MTSQVPGKSFGENVGGIQDRDPGYKVESLGESGSVKKHTSTKNTPTAGLLLSFGSVRMLSWNLWPLFLGMISGIPDNG